MKNRVVIYLIFFQLIIIACFIFNIYNKKSLVLGSTTIEPILKGEIISTPSSKLKFFYEPKPHSNDPGTLFAEGEIAAKYNINNDSLNDRYDYQPIKKDKTYRIITLGSSFTFGLYVNTEDNWTEILEDSLNKKLKCTDINRFEVINLGYRGYDNSYVVERFKRRGQKYDPNLIIWLQTPFLVPVEKTRSLTEKYYRPIKKTNLSQEVKTKEYIKASVKAREKVLANLGMAKIIDMQKELILSITDFYKGPLILFVSPGMSQDEKAVVKASVSARNNWLYSDTILSFTKFDDGHPDNNGHRMIAEDMFNYVTKYMLENCQKQ